MAMKQWVDFKTILTIKQLCGGWWKLAASRNHNPVSPLDHSKGPGAIHPRNAMHAGLPTGIYRPVKLRRPVLWSTWKNVM
jgi:hypothetical protein